MAFQKGHKINLGRKNCLGKHFKNPGAFKNLGKHSEKGSIPWNKGKEFKAIQGEKHWNWQGGISPLNRRLRASSIWKIWRELVFLRDNFICQNPDCKYCLNKIGVMLHPHHIKSLAKFPELAFIVSNGITHCAEFHINSKLLHKGILKEVN